MKYETLLALHMDPAHRSYRVTTDGTGRSWVEVPNGDTLGGHLETVIRMATVDDWPVIDRPTQHMRLIPTYAYDRVVVAGLRCSAPIGNPGPTKDYFGGRTQQEALRELMQEHGLSGAQVGALVGVNGRTIRRWLAPDDQTGHRSMSYAAWFTLLSKVHTQPPSVA